jgi:metallo-beta-lactamase family protein
MKLHFCGGAGVVTGVNYLLETKNAKILLDCGLFQGSKDLEHKNSEPFSYDPKEIKAVIVSHSHLDHIGRLPQLVKSGFEGKIYATPPTIDFTRLILEDSVRVLSEKAKKAGVVPLFSQNEVDELMRHFVAADYYKRTQATDDIYFTFHEAGHILGSAVIELEIFEKKIYPEPLDFARGKPSRRIVFSGDLGNPPAPLLRPPDFLDSADYVLVESTYGDRNHEPPQECEAKIEKVIEDAVSRGGVLMIPSFALERTQQLLYHLNNLIEHHRIPRVPVFIDSPLASRITEIYKKYPQYFNQQTTFEIDSGDDIFNFPGLRFTHSSKESKEINEVAPPKIIIAGSGMSQGGRIVHHEVRYLSGSQNTLLLVTYQAEGTPGRLISDGAKKVEILDQAVTINAKIEKISGYSAHADQQFLMDWLRSFKKACYAKDQNVCHEIKKIFIVQGETKAAQTLMGLVRDELGIDAQVPEVGTIAEL